MLKIEFNPKYVTIPIDETVAAYKAKYTTKEILMLVANKLDSVQKAIYRLALNIKDKPGFQIYRNDLMEVRYDVRPAGKMEDWFFNASKPGRHYRDHGPYYGFCHGHHRDHRPVCHGT